MGTASAGVYVRKQLPVSVSGRWAQPGAQVRPCFGLTREPLQPRIFGVGFRMTRSECYSAHVSVQPKDANVGIGLSLEAVGTYPVY
jgi:hypothetical protein